MLTKIKNIILLKYFKYYNRDIAFYLVNSFIIKSKTYHNELLINDFDSREF